MWTWKCVSRKQPPPWWAAECPCRKSEQAAAWEPVLWYNKFFHFLHESYLRCQLELFSSSSAHCICLLFVSFLALIFDIRLLTWRKDICALPVYSTKDKIGFSLDIELHFWVMGISSSFQELLSNSLVAWNVGPYCSPFQDCEEDGLIKYWNLRYPLSPLTYWSLPAATVQQFCSCSAN